MAEHTSRQGFRAFACVLRNRNFFWLWISQLISMIGDFFSYLAVPFLITALADGGEVAGVATEAGELSAEAKALVGLATLAFTAPRLLGIFTGAFVDRWNRHRTMVMANVVAGLVVLLPLLVNDLDAVWIVIAMQFALALVTRFIQPTQQAVIPLLVEEEDLLAANGLFSMSMTIGIIVGPMIAGITVANLGVKAAFVMDSLTFIIAAGILQVLVRIPPLENAPQGEGVRAVMANIWEGVRFIFVTPFLMATVFCFALFQGGVGGINAMWVPFLQETFGVGPIGVTTVDMAQGIGMALGAVALGILMSRTSLLMISAAGLVGIGLTLAGIGAASSYLLVIGVAFLLGIILVPVQSAISTLMQYATPKALQGRVFSSFFAITQAASMTMIAIITALVASIPLRVIFIGGGMAVTVAGILWTYLVRDSVRTLESNVRAAEQPAVIASTAE